jgi:putative MATE family efflux protein
LFWLTLPMVGGMLSMVTFHLADTYFVSLLDRGLEEGVHLAAMGYSLPVVQFIFLMAMGIGIGAASVISNAIGQGDPHRVQRLTTHSMALGFAIVVLLSTIGLLTMDSLFSLLGADDRTLPLVKEYMRVWYFGIPMLVLPMLANNALRAAGDTVWPAIIMAVAAGLNIILDPLLIFGMFGLPRLGLAGAAWATLLSRALTLIALLYILHARKRMLAIELPRPRAIWQSWKPVLYVGLPSALTNTLWPISQGVFVRLLSNHGDNAVAAFNAGSRVEGLAMLTLWSLASVLMAFVGQNWGAGKLHRVHRAETLSYRFSFLWGLFCWGVLAAMASLLAKVFGKGIEELQTYIMLYLFIAPAGYGMRGMTFLTARSFSALNRPMDATFVDFLRMFCMYIPMALLGSWLLGVPGLFGAVAVSNIAAGLVARFWFGRVQKRLEAQRNGTTPAKKPELSPDSSFSEEPLE